MEKRVVLLALALSLTACIFPPDSARTVTLVVGGEPQTVVTEALTVRDLLFEAQVILDENDRVAPAETTYIEDGMVVRVIRVDVCTEAEQREIPFEREVGRDASVPTGETRLLQSGVTGLEEVTYRIIIEDGEEVDRQILQRVTLRKPRNEIVLLGTQAELKPVPITGTVVFVADRNAWVMQTTSPNQRRLTHTGDLDGHVLALSPDGSYLLFTRVATETGESALINTLWMIETAAVDAEPVQLEAEGILWADWAPDCQGAPTGVGCRIAYSTGVRAEGDPGWRAANDLWVAWPRASDGRLFKQRRVLEPSAGGTYGWWGTTYAWSPGGQSLAYTRADEVGVVNVYSGVQTRLFPFSPYRTYASWAWTPTVSWSPEGGFIVTTLHGPSPTGETPEDSPIFDVWALDATGTISTELSSEAGMWASPAYALDGDLIAFFRSRSPYASKTSGYDLYLMDRDGSGQHPLFPPEGEIGLEYHPQMMTWGPGGDRLILLYYGNLHVIGTTTGEVQQLTSGGNATAVLWQW
ncbi:MAG: G5 domain-containing protein [Anaerolineae bacterium]|nr:G5 domain-containing protein [Anaerolineae bacterium]